MPAATAGLGLGRRRAVLGAAGGCALLVGAGPGAVHAGAPAAELVRNATSGTVHATVAAAVAAAAPGDELQVPAGVHAERLLLDRAVTVAGPADGPPATVRHATDAPYEPTVVVQAGVEEVRLENLAVRHRSPSVASNYAVQVSEGAALELVGCDVSSETGSGVGVEAGQLRASGTAFHDAAMNGICVYGDLAGAEGSGLAVLAGGCRVEGNGLNGILARGGARVEAEGCRVAGNAGKGAAFADATGTFRNCRWEGNRLGAVAAELGAEVERL